MLQNNLDPEVAENPDELVVYGGTGRAARSWDAYRAMLRTLTTLERDETMLVQSGKPVGVMRTHEWAPRVLIANSNLVPDWANWDEFRRLEHQGLTMYGQMTAGSWIYIGTQGILQGTYECFAEIARKRFGGTLAGTLTVTAGAGGMGGAQPLAVTMNDGVVLDHRRRPAHAAAARRPPLPRRDRPRLRLSGAPGARGQGQSRTPLSVGLLGNAADVVPRLLADGVDADIVTDQTSAHDPLSYLPNDLTPEAADELKRNDPDRVHPPVACRDGHALRGDGRFHGRRRRGVRLRQQPARRGASSAASSGRSTTPASCRPTSGRCSARASGRSGGSRCRAIRPTSPPPTGRCSKSSPTTRGSHRWIKLAGERVAFQGLPARICWLGYGERHRLGLRFNEMVRSGELKAPVVIGRDHLDSGSVASPYRETEDMIDGSDAIADWPLLNGLVNTCSGATWVSIHHGGGVGIGRSIHAGQVSVADGTDLAAEKLERVLTNDPAMGVIRHVDAGYERAIEVADERGVTDPACGPDTKRHPVADPDQRVGDRRATTTRTARSALRRASSPSTSPWPRRDRREPGRPLAARQAGERRR